MAKSNIIDRIEKLDGPKRAAALIMSLPAEHVSQVFQRLEEDEIRELSHTMASLGRVKAEVVEKLYTTFAEQVSSTGSLYGSFDSTERFLKQMLPDSEVDSIMQELRGPEGRTIWEKLANVNEEVLANFLKNEYPQTIALVLTKLRFDHAAKVLSKLPEELAMEVVMRMLKLDIVQKEVIEDVERTLRTEFMLNITKSTQHDPFKVMAEIFNSFDRSTETRFMENLEKESGEVAEKIKALMFTFEDLDRLDGPALQTVISNADKTKLALALKAATDELKELFFSNMSQRAAKLMKEEMENMGKVRLRDVEEAQLAIITTTKKLADSGEIEILEANDEEEFIG